MSADTTASPPPLPQDPLATIDRIKAFLAELETQEQATTSGETGGESESVEQLRERLSKLETERDVAEEGRRKAILESQILRGLELAGCNNLELGLDLYRGRCEYEPETGIWKIGDLAVESAIVQTLPPQLQKSPSGGGSGSATGAPRKKAHAGELDRLYRNWQEAKAHATRGRSDVLLVRAEQLRKQYFEAKARLEKP